MQDSLSTNTHKGHYNGKQNCSSEDVKSYCNTSENMTSKDVYEHNTFEQSTQQQMQISIDDKLDRIFQTRK